MSLGLSSFKANDWPCFSGGPEFLMSSVSSGCRPAVGSVTPHQLCLGSPLSLKGCVDLYTANVVVVGASVSVSDCVQKPREMTGHDLSWKSCSSLPSGHAVSPARTERGLAMLHSLQPSTGAARGNEERETSVRW